MNEGVAENKDAVKEVVLRPAGNDSVQNEVDSGKRSSVRDLAAKYGR